MREQMKKLNAKIMNKDITALDRNTETSGIKVLLR